MAAREINRRPGKIKKRIAITAIFLTIIAGTAFGVWLETAPTGGANSNIIDRIRQELLSRQESYGDPVNILLIGSDSRGGERARSDTLILMRLDFRKKRLYLISIPRDMRVYLPGRGKDKINAAYAYGQASLSIQTVENFLGVDLNHYVEVDFQSFKKLVDTLGGIDINVKEPINDRSRQFSMFIPKGNQHMDGDTALNYVRYRHGDSDFGRAQRQQEFLRALIGNTFKFKSVFKFPRLIKIVNDNVGTDMNRREMLSIGRFMGKVSKKRVESITLPGRSKMIERLSYIEPDRAMITDILETVEAGHSVEKMKSQKESDKISSENRLLSVSLLNGSGKAGLATRAKARLIKQGFSNVKIGNADRFNFKQTEIRYGAKLRAEAYRVRRLFFGSALMTQTSTKLGSDIEIILGFDYYRFERAGY